jgi:hypothetical protein
MKHIYTAFASLSLAAFLVIGLGPSAKADEWDKRTNISINEPIRVPGMVLQPGSYVFKLMNDNADRHIVQIFNADESHLMTTILAIPNYRLQPTGKSEFLFWETPAGQPRALRAWFYPGDNFGQEFQYKGEATTYAANTTTTETPAPAPAPAPAPEVAQTEPAPPPPAAQPAPEPQPQPEVAQNTPPPAPPEMEQAPQTLPHTATNYPLIAMGGLLSLAAFALMGLRVRHNQ